MVSLKEAIKLCDLKDSDSVFLRNEGASYWETELVSIKAIKDEFNMNHVKVVHILPTVYGDWDTLEFEVRNARPFKGDPTILGF